MFIGISGLIGAGKTTLATALAKVLGLPVYYEPVIDNEYLEDYYRDMDKYAFPLQVYLLNRRFKQHQQIVWGGHGGVQDRLIYEDTVFAKMLCRQGHMDERDYRTYISLFSNMSSFMKKPNIIVHLDVSPEESLRRIHMRSRGCESGIKLEFLQVQREVVSGLRSWLLARQVLSCCGHHNHHPPSTMTTMTTTPPHDLHHHHHATHHRRHHHRRRRDHHAPRHHHRHPLPPATVTANQSNTTTTTTTTTTTFDLPAASV